MKKRKVTSTFVPTAPP